MRRYLRLVTLANTARLRAAGIAPWLLFLGWMSMAGFQEPRFLRLYGIHLLDEAAWAGGTLLLLVLLLAEPARGRTDAHLSNLALLIAMALVQCLAALVFDFALGRATFVDHLLDGAGFILCWAPLALTLAAGVGCHRRSLLPGAMATIAFALGGTQSVAWSRGDLAQVVLASCLAAIGACLWRGRSLPGSP